jgi:hypothetical protein
VTFVAPNHYPERTSSNTPAPLKVAMETEYPRHTALESFFPSLGHDSVYFRGMPFAGVLLQSSAYHNVMSALRWLRPAAPCERAGAELLLQTSRIHLGIALANSRNNF